MGVVISLEVTALTFGLLPDSAEPPQRLSRRETGSASEVLRSHQAL